MAVARPLHGHQVLESANKFKSQKKAAVLSSVKGDEQYKAGRGPALKGAGFRAVQAGLAGLAEALGSMLTEPARRGRPRFCTPKCPQRLMPGCGRSVVCRSCSLTCPAPPPAALRPPRRRATWPWMSPTSAALVSLGAERGCCNTGRHSSHSTAGAGRVARRAAAAWSCNCQAPGCL